MRIDIEKALLLITGVIISIFIICILSGCSKDDPKPVIQQAPTAYASQLLSIIVQGNTATLTINGVEQVNIAQTFTLNKGDVIEIVDSGFDTTLIENGNLTRQEGRVVLQVIIDNIIVYEANCNCNAYYTQTI